MQRLQSLYPASSASDNVSNVPIVSGGKAADEKTRLRVDDSTMASFAVIKHEPHLPFRYDSIIAGAVYNNTDSLGYADTGTPETQKNRLFRRLFRERWSECH